MSKVYKCCYNCSGGIKCALPRTKTKENAEYYERCERLNITSRFCVVNLAGSGYAKDAFKQRYCKNFEVKNTQWGETLLSKSEATAMYEKLGCKPGR